ncbi:MAG: hypothetical protein IJ176_04050 [Prevotella sp.]|nr:hypothetical protein [Prevotella sp.]
MVTRVFFIAVVRFLDLMCICPAKVIKLCETAKRFTYLFENAPGGTAVSRIFKILTPFCALSKKNSNFAAVKDEN